MLPSSLDCRKKKRKANKRNTKRTHRRVYEGPGLVFGRTRHKFFHSLFFLTFYTIYVITKKTFDWITNKVNVLCAYHETQLLLVFQECIPKSTVKTKKTILKNTMIKTINKNLESAPKKIVKYCFENVKYNKKTF